MKKHLQTISAGRPARAQSSDPIALKTFLIEVLTALAALFGRQDSENES